MDTATLLTFAAAYLIATASPGPGIAAVVAQALGAGFAATLPMVAGLVLGDLVYLAFAAFGLALVASHLGALFILVKWAGAAYLLYMAYKLWTAPETGPGEAETAGRSPLRTFLAGLSMTLGNPKVIMFFLALLPTLVDLEHLTALGFLELCGLAALILTGVACAYAGLAARARHLLRSPAAVRLMNRGAGAVMAGAAVSIAAR